jgi:hypothetical protein
MVLELEDKSGDIVISLPGQSTWKFGFGQVVQQSKGELSVHIINAVTSLLEAVQDSIIEARHEVWPVSTLYTRRGDVALPTASIESNWLLWGYKYEAEWVIELPSVAVPKR